MENHKISITENGTTTLATAGKYCDRNIDVIADVPTYETELEEQKAITDSIVNGSIVEYVNDTITEFRSYAFSNCKSLTKIKCDALILLNSYSFRDCTSLKEVRFDSLTEIKFGGIFEDCSTLEKLILGSSTLCALNNANAFRNSAIVNGTGYIYVPDNLVDTYKTATNWVTYADQIKPISELEE